MKVLKMATALLSTTILMGCGGAGVDQAWLDQQEAHKKLAESFVSALNASGEYTVQLVKTFTNQTDYIVILDADTNEYRAVDIGDFKAGDDVVQYINSATIYEDLDFIPGYYTYDVYEYYDLDCECYLTDVDQTWHETTYRDRWTGMSFEKANETPKDIALYAEVAEETIVSSRALGVSEKFGLSVDRSKDVVRLAMAWERAGGKDLTNKDQDAFSQEMLGFSITEAKGAIKAKAEGVDEPLENLIERAAETNDTTPEHVKSLIDTYIGQ